MRREKGSVQAQATLATLVGFELFWSEKRAPARFAQLGLDLELNIQGHMVQVENCIS
jgi:hypothetical protein